MKKLIRFFRFLQEIWRITIQKRKQIEEHLYDKRFESIIEISPKTRFSWIPLIATIISLIIVLEIYMYLNK